MSSFKRVRTNLIAALLVGILVVSILAVYVANLSNRVEPSRPVYVGVAFGGNTTAEAKALIDEVKGYTNLFILDAGRNPISANQSAVEDICNYAVANGQSVIINMGVKDPFNASDWNWFWQQSTLDATKQRWKDMWGDKFLGGLL